MAMLQENRPPELTGAALEAGSERKQRRLMLVALALLLVALILVLAKDRSFWFPGSATAESDVDQDTGDVGTTSTPSTSSSPGSPTRSKPKIRAAAESPVPDAQTAMTPPPVVVNRAALPPLEIEVVAGNKRRTVRPNTSSVKVDMQGEEAAADTGGVSSASERVNLSQSTMEVVQHPVGPSYPLLAKQSKVQGSVVLQALIGKEGSIQDLQVVSGPAILSVAAREAVKQWRFKPYLQSGQAVESEARITVNFVISTN